MATALWRKLLADIKSNRLQFVLIWGVLALSTMLLLLSVLLLGSTEDPWRRTFEATNGPHIWVVSHQYDLDFSPITEDAAVDEHSGVIMALAENPMVLGDEKRDIFIYAMDELRQVARPLVVEGRWLDPGNSDEVVLDYSLARYYEFDIGDAVTILTPGGTHDLDVVGLAVTSHWFPYNEVTKDVSPGVTYVSQATLERLQPDQTYWYSSIGLRLVEPETSKEFGDWLNEVFPGKLRSVLDWQFVEENAAMANTLNAMFMGLFSVMGLAAVGMIIFNTIGGQVVSQYRNIGLLKAIGLKPRQVMIIFLCEHLVIGLMAAAAGIVLGLLVAPDLVGQLAENLNAKPPDIYAPGSIILVVVLVEVTVGIATLIPAWQGSRIDTVRAITIGYRRRHRRSSWLANLSSRLGMPTVITMGVKDTFTQSVRTVLAILSLLLTVMVAMTASGAITTTRHLANNRVYFNGTSADMKVMRNFVPASIIEKEILTNPEIDDHYEELFVWGQAPDHSEQPIGFRLLSGNYHDFDFQIKEGQMISSPDEAMVGYAVFDLLDMQLGDTAEFLVDGHPVTLTVVGRYAENLNLSNIVITSLETYQNQGNVSLEPQSYYLRIKDDASADELRTAWLDRSQGLLNISVITNEPLSSVVQLTNLIVSVAAILMCVAGANLMSNSLLSIQERVRDFGIQKTLGFTPMQIAGSVVVGAVTLVAISLLLGVTMGMKLMEWFIGQVGIEIGAGPDFYLIHWGGISLMLLVFVLLATIISLIPAIRAARLEIIEALRYE